MKEHMPFVVDDGGRAAAGYKGKTGDCVVRAVAIASGRPYAEIYAAMSRGMGTQRKTRGATVRRGVTVSRVWFKRYMQALGFTWTPTMQIGSGCTTHLAAGELPFGRLVVSVSKHYTAVSDGSVRDTFDPQRGSGRCVYGYWTFNG